MWKVDLLTRELGEPFEVLEDTHFVEVWCREHGFVSRGLGQAMLREDLIAIAERHRRAFHCGDA